MLLRVFGALLTFVFCLGRSHSEHLPGNSDEGCLVHPDVVARRVDLLEYPPKQLFQQGPVGAASSHQINAKTRGYVITDSAQADLLSKLSCQTREVAFHVTLALMFEGLHPLVQISDARHNFMGDSLTIVVDTRVDLARLTFLHKGKPHVEVLPLRLPIEKWRDLVFVFSGNQLQLVMDCQILLVRTIPMPDLCFSTSSTVLVGEATTPQGALIYKGAMQNASFIFGNKGYMSICPNLQHDCSTCAESLSHQQKIRELEAELKETKAELTGVKDEMNSLKAASTSQFESFDFFDTFKNSKFVADLKISPFLGASGGDAAQAPSDKCLVHGMQYSSGEFFHFSFIRGVSVTCMCFFGSMVCERGSQRGRTDPYYKCQIGNEVLPENTYKVRKFPGFCTLMGCPSIDFPPIRRAERQCNNGPQSSCGALRGSTDMQDITVYRLMVCCGECDPCEEGACPRGASCFVDQTHANHTCACPEGMHFRPASRFVESSCIPLNECLDASVCPGNSVCVDEPVGHRCNCTRPGYFWNNSTNLCEDIDECAEGSVECPPFSSCQNQEGSYSCVCQSGYHRSTPSGQCQPYCNPGCRNGGVCLIGEICVCQRGFTGPYCEEDIDECSPGSSRCGPLRVCTNTLGSYYCTCRPGYMDSGSGCENIDECKLKLDTCPRTSRCLDTEGSYRCECQVSGVIFNCTGQCWFNHQLLKEGEFFINNRCKDCLCKNGATVCTELTCDCDNQLTLSSDKCCTRYCRQQRGCQLPDGSYLSAGDTSITQGGCQKCFCNSKRELSCHSTVQKCANISYCPDQLRASIDGVCCPMCKVPDECTEGKTEIIDNGCRQCSCSGGEWSCTAAAKCPVLSCSDEDQVYHLGQCCPTCRELPTLQQSSPDIIRGSSEQC